MEWWTILVIFLIVLTMLFFMGIPVAFAFGLINTLMILLFIRTGGVEGALSMIASSYYYSIANFTFVCIPFFIFMGELLYHSEVAGRALDVIILLAKGHIRGVLYYVTIVGGVMLGAITGSSMASTIIMGSVTLQEGIERGYHKRLLTGVITASGSLAQLIPPSIFMVVFGGLSMLSVGKLLIGGILPGLLLASLFVIFIIIASIVKPDIMPLKGSISSIHWKEKLKIFLRDVLPLSLIFITITGVIYFNLGTPTEAAAGGAFATLVLAAAHKKLGWVSLKKSISGTLRTTSMVLLIIGGAKAFSQILTWTGVSRGVSLFVVGLQLPSLLTMFALLGILVIMGCFMEGIAIMFITVPFYFPIASTFGWDPLWFGILMVVAINLGVITPPFGVALFALKGVSPPDVSMADIFSGSIPFTILTLIGLVFLSLVPSAVVWLPNMMK